MLRLCDQLTELRNVHFQLLNIICFAFSMLDLGPADLGSANLILGEAILVVWAAFAGTG